MTVDRHIPRLTNRNDVRRLDVARVRFGNCLGLKQTQPRDSSSLWAGFTIIDYYL